MSFTTKASETFSIASASDHVDAPALGLARERPALSGEDAGEPALAEDVLQLLLLVERGDEQLHRARGAHSRTAPRSEGSSQREDTAGRPHPLGLADDDADPDRAMC